MIQLLYSAVGFVVALGLLVAVHEFGHYWVARRVGVKVLRFSIGFGRPLWSRRAGRDATEYVIGAIPLGGYVKMLDEHEGEVAEEEKHRAFNRQSLPRRTAVVVAGPLFNFLFAIVAYFLAYTVGIEGLRPVVGHVVEGSVAEQAGFEEGEEILAVGGRTNNTWSENRLYVFNEAVKRNRVQFEVRTNDGERVTREIDLGQIPLRAVDSALIEQGIGLIGYIPRLAPVLGEIMDDSPASRAGLQPGDEIVEVDGQPVASWRDLVEMVRDRPGEQLRVTVRRDGVEQRLAVTPARVDVDGGAIGRIGVTPQPGEIPPEMLVDVRYGPLMALWRSVESTWVMSALTLRMLIKMVQLEVSAKNISGPITIAQYAGQTVQVGLDRFLLFLAVVSISLGVLNLLPIPILDGGHLLYYIAEAITGQPLSERVMGWGQQIGIVMLFCLMSLAFYNDIARLIQ